MKDKGLTRKILGLDIKRDRHKWMLTLSQFGYTKKVIKLYDIMNAKPIHTPLGTLFKLKSIVSLEKFDFIKKTFYSNVIDSLMYAIIGIRLDIADLISLINKFMSKPCKEQDIEVFAFSTIWIYLVDLVIYDIVNEKTTKGFVGFSHVI